VVAATDRLRLGELHSEPPYFVKALRSNDTVFTTYRKPDERARSGSPIRAGSRSRTAPLLGVILVEVDLRPLRAELGGISDAVLVTDSEGRSSCRPSRAGAV
jgi:two-component system C4-dicarboxylate transport sensor histidine kinase DctB